jgi:hypothetical protein
MLAWQQIVSRSSFASYSRSVDWGRVWFKINQAGKKAEPSTFSQPLSPASKLALKGRWEPILRFSSHSNLTNSQLSKDPDAREGKAVKFSL